MIELPHNIAYTGGAHIYCEYFMLKLFSVMNFHRRQPLIVYDKNFSCIIHSWDKLPLIGKFLPLKLPTKIKHAKYCMHSTYVYRPIPNVSPATLREKFTAEIFYWSKYPKLRYEQRISCVTTPLPSLHFFSLAWDI